MRAAYRCDAVSLDGGDLRPGDVASEPHPEVEGQTDDLAGLAHGLHHVVDLVVDAQVALGHQLRSLEEHGPVLLEHPLGNPPGVLPETKYQVWSLSSFIVS